MKNLSLSAKIWIVVFMFVVLSVSIMGLGLQKMSELNSSLDYIAKTVTPRMTILKDVSIAINEIKNQEKTIILAETTEGMQGIASRIDGLIERVEGLQERRMAISTEAGKKDVEAIDDLFSKWVSLHGQIRQLAFDGKNVEATNLARRDSIKIFTEVDTLMDDMLARGEAEMESELKLTDEMVEQAVWAMIVLSSVFTLLGIITAFFTLRSINKGITQAVEQIGSGANEVGAASNQLSAASHQVSAGTTEAASSLEETVASIEELSSMVRLNSDNAKEAASLSRQSSQAATDGEKEIQNLIHSMSEISESAKKINEIIGVIDDIAFQTNLLALNAAVEAARAGEQGKGFAIVAEAVRTLAQKSADAAKEITNLISESVGKTDNGKKIADQSGVILKEIVLSVKKVADLNNEISSASEEQSNGISQISKAMNELDTATQQNASASEEVAASSEEMSSQAVVLQGLVHDLNGLVYGLKKAEKITAETSKHRGSHLGSEKKISFETKSHHGNLKLLNKKSNSTHTHTEEASEIIPFETDLKNNKVEGF